jgi:hypothetical protein
VTLAVREWLEPKAENQIRTLKFNFVLALSQMFKITPSIGNYRPLCSMQDTIPWPPGKPSIPFISAHEAALTVYEEGEHWFHTPEQLEFLDQWIMKQL